MMSLDRLILTALLEKYQAMQATCMLSNLKIYMAIPLVKRLLTSITAISLRDKTSKQRTNTQAHILLTSFHQVKDYNAQQLIS